MLSTEHYHIRVALFQVKNMSFHLLRCAEQTVLNSFWLVFKHGAPFCNTSHMLLYNRFLIQENNSFCEVSLT